MKEGREGGSQEGRESEREVVREGRKEIRKKRRKEVRRERRREGMERSIGRVWRDSGVASGWQGGVWTPPPGRYRSL